MLTFPHARTITHCTDTLLETKTKGFSMKTRNCSFGLHFYNVWKMQCSDRSRPSQDSQSNKTIFSTAFIQINKIDFPIDSHSNSVINIICFYKS